ncbi:hypothetical protein GGF46_001320 [Coemansia sp. RSA 552]|nr:hypothetical protein GGF46_001320 [Coemansia sp. RSA 552]
MLQSSRPLPAAPSFESVSETIARPPYAETGSPPSWDQSTPILSPEEISYLRAASHIARDALALGGSMVRPGVTTEEIDQEVHRFIVGHNAYPSCLNYLGFPKSVCTSVNNVIAHGIPDSRKLVDGDIINIDVTVFKHGFHGDTSSTFGVGDVDDQGVALMDTTKEALDRGIGACRPAQSLEEIGRRIGSLARARGYSISEDLTGHGVGRNFHQNPLVYHHENEEGGVMLAGMAFTIEPILCQGTAVGETGRDGWTVLTRDGGRSAQFEHTVLITDTGVEVLTL